MAKTSKKDGSTKQQKNKGNTSKKTSSSANGENGYH